MPPETIYNVLHEECFRATWDTNMKKGYNITRFTRNNDIGYYELGSIAPLVSPRDFCNQRGWIELGKDHFMICNTSKPHAKEPPKKGVVRGTSFITAYYIRPSHSDPTGTTVTYVTCADPGGYIPKSLVTMVTHNKGPGALVGLYKAAQDLDKFLYDVYAKAQANGGKAVAGPWDKTLEKPGTYHPRDPATKGVYRIPENPLDREGKQLQALIEEEAGKERAIREEYERELAGIIESAGIAAVRKGSIRRVSSLRQHFEGVEDVQEGGDDSASGGGVAEPVGPAMSQSAAKKLTRLEGDVRQAEEENRHLKERLAVFSRTSGADPLTRVPANEAPVCSTFRKKVSDITDNIAVELEDAGRLSTISTEDYLSIVLARLERDHPLPQTAVRKVCPSGHEGVPYDQINRLVEYKHYPNLAEVCIVIVALLTLIASTVVNVMTIVYCFIHSLWPIGCHAIATIIIGDLSLYFACRDTHYKDAPLSQGGRVMPLLWPVRLQLIPVIPCEALMLLKRVPGEMTSVEVRPTHANLVYRFTFFYCLLRVFLHNGPMMYIWGVVQYRTDDRDFFSEAYWLVVLIHNVVFPTWVALWMFMLAFSPPPTQQLNLCGLPSFPRWPSTILWTLFFVGIVGATSYFILFNDRTYEYLD
eukprot:TRINITY_DN27973_c0_g1_i2.p1 TRINITY_DN27973_c0_g1~~TRINITY_DN27973_c0_g1_i2.p1  ORF type:complete len:644 (+),score=191.97 TRINITY_DN27973_c0_g1_i2:396-2327(+)